MTELTFDAAIKFAADLIRIPSPPGGEEAVARRVMRELGRLGFDDARVDDVGNVIGVIRGRGEAAPVMLSSHLDVVDPGDVSTWDRAPYGGEVADGYLHGRGAMDIKGPLALQTYAAARFIRDRPAGDLIVAHTVLEERGGWGMAHLMESSEVGPGAVILGEATGGDICIGHRGRAEVEVEVRGVAGHASAPERARNALDAVGPILAALRDLPATLPGEENGVLGRESMAVTDVSVAPASRNVIPDRVIIVADWRVLPGRTAEEGLALVRDYLAQHIELPSGLTFEVRYAAEEQSTWTGRSEVREMFGAGFLLDAEHEVTRAAVRAVESATGSTPSVRPWRFATDGRYTCGERGIPTIGYAPGREEDAHTNTERLELEPARLIFEAYPELIHELYTVL